MVNPYKPPTASELRNFKWLGTAVGATALLISTIPACYLVYMMIEMYLAISAMASPPQNLRPVGGVIEGFKWSMIGLLAFTPICLLANAAAKRLGSDAGTECAMIGAVLFVFPIGIGIVGPMIVIAVTGAGYGT